MDEKYRLSRRSGLKGIGVMGATALLGAGAGGMASLSASEPPQQPTDLRKRIFAKVWETPLAEKEKLLAAAPWLQDRPSGDIERITTTLQ